MPRRCAEQAWRGIRAQATNDPKDRHVLAAAVRCGAQVIVTYNKRHAQAQNPGRSLPEQLRDLRKVVPSFAGALWNTNNGLELARRIRGIDPVLPLLMVSGYFYGDDEAVQKGLADGLIYGFVSKPFFHDEILKVIEIRRPG